MRRSAVLGSDCSLKNSLMPSAMLWNSPNGPARSGPDAVLHPAMTLRRNQMYISTETSSSTNTAIVLPITISTTVVSRPWLEQRVGDATRIAFTGSSPPAAR